MRRGRKNGFAPRGQVNVFTARYWEFACRNSQKMVPKTAPYRVAMNSTNFNFTVRISDEPSLLHCFLLDNLSASIYQHSMWPKVDECCSFGFPKGFFNIINSKVQNLDMLLLSRQIIVSRERLQVVIDASGYIYTYYTWFLCWRTTLSQRDSKTIAQRKGRSKRICCMVTWLLPRGTWPPGTYQGWRLTTERKQTCYKCCVNTYSIAASNVISVFSNHLTASARP